MSDYHGHGGGVEVCVFFLFFWQNGQDVIVFSSRLDQASKGLKAHWPLLSEHPFSDRQASMFLTSQDSSLLTKASIGP